MVFNCSNLESFHQGSNIWTYLMCLNYTHNSRCTEYYLFLFYIVILLKLSVTKSSKPIFFFVISLIFHFLLFFDLNYLTKLVKILFEFSLSAESRSSVKSFNLEFLVFYLNYIPRYSKNYHTQMSLSPYSFSIFSILCKFITIFTRNIFNFSFSESFTSIL